MDVRKGKQNSIGHEWVAFGIGSPKHVLKGWAKLHSAKSAPNLDENGFTTAWVAFGIGSPKPKTYAKGGVWGGIVQNLPYNILDGNDFITV